MATILIVEDDEKYRTMLTGLLEEEHYTVLTAGNGEEALTALHEHPEITLIVLDLIMPNMDGLTFFYHLKKTLGSSKPVIILTNLTETAYPQDSDIKDFIIKANIGLPELLTRIKSQVTP